MTRSSLLAAALSILSGCRTPPSAQDAAPEPSAPLERAVPAGDEASPVAEEPPPAPPAIRITSCRTDHPCGYGIEIARPGEEPLLLTVDEDRECRPSLSPDGEHLAFLDRGGLKVASTRTGSTEASFDINAETTVAYDRPDPCIAWSPDGTKLAIVALNEKLYGTGKLVVLDVATGARHRHKVRALVLCGDRCYTTSPLWSGDGLYVIVLEPRIHVPDPPLFRVYCGSTGDPVASLPAKMEDCDGCYADMFTYGWTDGGRLFFEASVDAKIRVEVPFDPGEIACPPHASVPVPGSHD